MPFLDESKYPQNQLIADINAGTSFVKVIPDNIGDLLYFDTTEPKAEPLADKVYTRRKIITAIVTIIAIAGIWFGLHNYIGWSIILTVVASVIGLLFYLSQSFSGDDFFVGTEGYAIYHFVKNRDNVETKKLQRYSDGFLLLHKEVVKYKDNNYDGTDYSFTYIGKPNDKDISNTIDEVEGSYYSGGAVGNTGHRYYDFWYRIEDQLTSRYLYAADNLLKEGKSIPFFIAFKGRNKTWETAPFILLSPGVIKYGNKTFTKDNLKRVYVKRGVLHFEEVYQPNIKTTGKMEVPLEMIGNRKAFLILLSKLYGID
ncbi:MAG: hypothetical protein IJK74_06605 [Bacteroidales bacterium]|nr:hypothetical protein [Bacteroidales bacterium]